MENNTDLIERPATEFVNHQEFSKKADKIIKNHAMMGTVAGLIPITGLDVAAVTGVQVRMIKQLSDLFGLPFEANTVRVTLGAFVATALSRLASGAMRKYFNSFNGFGAATELTHAAIAGFITAATGEIYKIHFQEGGDIETLNVVHFWTYFQEQVEAGLLSPSTFKEVETGFRYLFKS